MSKLTRRDFLKKAAAGAGALSLGAFLDACSQVLSPTQPATQAPVPTPIQPSATSIPPAATVPAALTSTAQPPTLTASPVPIPDLVVTTGGEPEALVRRAVAALGGMERFVPKGAGVIVKPNICVAYHTYEYAATTNPWVVGTLVKMAFEAGAASVKVMDFPFGGTAQKAYEISGIKQQVEAAGGEMVFMLPYRYVVTKNPKAVVLKNPAVFDDILKTAVLINVPIAKTHSSSKLTLGMKNLMGVVQDRSAMHINLGQCIADLNALIRPQLTVVDAVRILTANGPTGGYLADVKQLNTLIASPDVVAADSYAASLFGMKPEDLDYIVKGVAMSLGRSDLQNLNIQKITVSA
jgi:uncharacterized protein (DUF362 family)